MSLTMWAPEKAAKPAKMNTWQVSLSDAELKAFSRPAQIAEHFTIMSSPDFGVEFGFRRKEGIATESAGQYLEREINNKYPYLTCKYEWNAASAFWSITVEAKSAGKDFRLEEMEDFHGFLDDLEGGKLEYLFSFPDSSGLSALARSHLPPRTSLPAAKETEADQIRRLQAEVDALKEELALARGEQSAPRGP